MSLVSEALDSFLGAPLGYRSRFVRGVRAAGFTSSARVFATGGVVLAGGVAGFLDLSGSRGLGVWWAVVLFVLGGIAGLHSLRLPAGRVFVTPDGRGRIVIRVGDIWRTDGHRVIPVNEFFDSEIGDRVSPGSLHGQAIETVFGGNSAAFEAAVDSRLASECGQLHACYRRRQYPIGTTCVVPLASGMLFLVALSRTDLATRKASADVADLWQALNALWQAVRLHSNGETVVVPLVGSGQSQVPLSPRGLLEVLLLSIVHASRERAITPEIVVLLTPACFAELNLATFDL